MGVYGDKNRNVGKDIKVTSASRRGRKFALYVFLRGDIKETGKVGNPLCGRCYETHLEVRLRVCVLPCDHNWEWTRPI